MFFRSRPEFVLAAMVLAGCSDSAGPAEPTGALDATADAPEMEAGSPPDSAPDVLPPASDGGCVCIDTRDSGVFETSLSCYCGAGCSDYTTTIAGICGQFHAFNVVESSFTGCSVKEVSYVIGASETRSFFDTTTGAFVGGRYDDDTRGVCPGTSQRIGFSTATGTYEVPTSCVPAGQRNPCPSEGGPSDAASDGGPSDAASDGRVADAPAE